MVLTNNDENDALIVGPSQTTAPSSSHNVQQETKPTPLPKFQLFITYLIQFAEPVTALVIYPFVNQFVRETGITNGDDTKTGYYAGIIESAFFLSEFLCVVQWGYLSDRYGRRPVLLLGPLGLSIAMLCFGLSTTFWSLVFFRCLQGIFNGNIGVTKTVIAELTDETNVGDAYAYTSFMWSTANAISPMIGGFLSEPADQWPDTFGRIVFFQRYPYFLPCATAASLAFSSYCIALFGLKETSPSLVAERGDDKDNHSLLNHQDLNVSYGTTPSAVSGNAETRAVVEEPSSPSIERRNGSFYTLIHRPLMLVFLNYSFLTFLDMARAVLLPLMYSMPIKYGGLGLTPFYIGTCLACFGFLNAVFQAKFQGRWMRKLGRRRLYRLGMSSLLITFSMFPITKRFAQKAGGVDAVVWVCIAIHLASVAGLSLAYGSMQVLIVQSVPEGGLMGTANGLGQMIGTSMRTIAPALTSSLFSVSLQRNLAGGNFVYYVLIALTLLGVRMSFLLIEPPKRKESI